VTTGGNDWTAASPAPQAVVEDLQRSAPKPLPAEYLAFLATSNGGEGELGAEPGWFRMWRAEEVIRLNADYEVPLNVPGLIGFGSSGGGEMLAFDTRHGEPYPVVAVPFIPMAADEAIVVAKSFHQFSALIGLRREGGE
jgi:hypothetical protein